MIVTIDGPAGAGKSTVARRLAERLGFRFLDTGAMYRAVALAAIQRDVDLRDGAAVAELAQHLQIRFVDRRVMLDGLDVTDDLRTLAVTAVIHYVADNPAVRERMVELQRQFAVGENVVTEGRDQGTIVFPEAECKIFLTASPEERARRRHQDLAERGVSIPYEDVLAEQETRDHRDTTRTVGRLRAAEDAVMLLSDGMTQDQVVDELERIVREQQRERQTHIE